MNKRISSVCLAACILGIAGCSGQNKQVSTVDRTDGRTLVGISYEKRVGMVYGADEDYTIEAGRIVFARYYSPEEAEKRSQEGDEGLVDGGYVIVKDAAIDRAAWDSLKDEVMRIKPLLREIPKAKAVSFLKKLLPRKMVEETDGPNCSRLHLTWRDVEGNELSISYNAPSDCAALLSLMRSVASGKE